MRLLHLGLPVQRSTAYNLSHSKKFDELTTICTCSRCHKQFYIERRRLHPGSPHYCGRYCRCKDSRQRLFQKAFPLELKPDGCDLREIANTMHISHERVRQLQNASIAKIRDRFAKLKLTRISDITVGEHMSFPRFRLRWTLFYKAARLNQLTHRRDKEMAAAFTDFCREFERLVNSPQEIDQCLLRLMISSNCKNTA